MPTEQELRDALNRIKVSDVLVETMQGLASLGYHKLAPDSRDLEQTRLAIEALKALNATLERSVPQELTRDFNQAIANLQLAFASAASDSPSREPPPSQEPPSEQQPEEQPANEQDEGGAGGG